MKISKKVWGILAVMLAATFLLPQIPHAEADKTVVQEKMLSALKEVVGIDVDKYVITVTGYFASPVPGFEELYRDQEELDITLKSPESQLTVTAEYSNNHINYMRLYQIEGSASSIHYANKVSTDPLVATREVLERLQKFTGNPVISDLQKILESAKDVNDLDGKTVGNIKCKVNKDTSMFVDPDDPRSPINSIYFMYSFNGAESRKSIGVHFNPVIISEEPQIILGDSYLAGFHDDWDLYSVGSEDLKISKEQAIAIAREQAIDAAGSVTLEFPPDRAVTVELRTSIRDNATVLYPYWFVEVPLVYSGDLSMYGWQLSIWADTGEIASSNPVGGYGTMPDDTNNSSNNPTTPADTNLFLIIGIIAVIITVSLITVAVLKKR
ncbi:MAG: hypothetical protein ACQCN3_09650 [Candidatus Bathyarchaeia archaeon]|jgi:hypothetical protein